MAGANKLDLLGTTVTSKAPKSRTEFDTLLNHLATEGGSAGDHWYLLEPAARRAPDDFSEEIHQTPQFWRLTNAGKTNRLNHSCQRRRLWELMKSQGLQENQHVVFMSDGGENVRRMQEYLHPYSEHLIDWFHITVGLTVLQQQTKGLKQERPQSGDVSKPLESVKHLLWHGNTEEALERLSDLILDLSVIQAHSVAAHEVGMGLVDFETYMRLSCFASHSIGQPRRTKNCCLGWGKA